MGLFNAYATSLLCSLSLLFGVWLFSVGKKDASLVDRVWGAGFALIAWVLCVRSESLDNPRAVLVAALVGIWGLRLSFHISLRNRGHGEDPRYQVMRRHWGARFWWVSAFTVFGLQGVLMSVIALPLCFVYAYPLAALTWLDGAGLVVWLTGFVFEAGGDWQLVQFKRNPANKGKLLTTGFWSLTRHPNYFGDACVWWGHFLFACSAPWGWLSVPGPLVMNWLLYKVSGVALLEKTLRDSKPGYADYIARTPAFLPFSIRKRPTFRS